MANFGFWNFAQENPEHIAVIDPQGRRVTAGELLAASNRLVHGLRSLGMQRGDCVAAVLPNGTPMLEV